ncbi:MAG: prephenate dehydratase [Alphaproteobacteria bacterium]
MNTPAKKIAFQGARGAYSDVSCRTVYPGMETLPCLTFHDAFAAVKEGKADLAMIPVDNTLAGRVADVHHLIPESNLYIIGEFFLPIHHCLVAPKGAEKEELKFIHSHVHALPQCRKLLARLPNAKPQVHADTAGAAEDVARMNDKTHAAISSALAAEIYGLDILEENVQDADHNTTRFLVLSPEPQIPSLDDATDVLTSLVFKVRHIPASLYKSLGGFATNGFSLSKLESYEDPNFQRAQFYCEVEGHVESEPFQRALEELGFFARDVKFLGCYPAHKFRQTYKQREGL